jgi:putative ABC transport system permease protein
VRALHDELYARFGALPGVRSISMTMDTPPAGELSMCASIEIPGRPADPEDAPPVCRNYVGPRAFETMGIPVLAGRDFEVGDDERASQVVVISESLARRYFGTEGPLGRQLIVGGARPPDGVVTTSIVGVVKDVRYMGPRADAPLMIYRPYRQEPGAPAHTFLIRTSSATADALTPLLRAELRAAAPALPPPSIVSLEDRVASALVDERLLAALASAIGVLAAVLAAIGIYSMVGSAVARRRREIGIRMALGALPGQVARMVVTEAFAMVLGGLALGIPAAIATALAARAVLTGVLFEVSPVDPLSFSGAAAAILLIASLAAYLPARRASTIDPVSATRAE